jgi:hypothetical protein
VKQSYIQIAGVLFSIVFGVFIIFLYAAEPRSLEEVSLKARTTIDSLATKGQVAIGTYEVDAQLFAQALAAFRSDNFVLARDLFERADPERRDARTQYYIAYSYYRQGWGRVSSDDELFRKSLESVERVTLIDPAFRAADPDLKLGTPAELRAELEEGLRITLDDFNPLRVFRERK